MDLSWRTNEWLDIVSGNKKQKNKISLYARQDRKCFIYIIFLNTDHNPIWYLLTTIY